ncbi:MAG: ABC transporter ATP-binding protein [Nitrospiraceae bacterium]|nr:ABC transporter ATP-binding protein [Nitrospiraceae bacterium]
MAGVLQPQADPEAYQVQSVRFRYRSAASPDAGWALDGVTFHVHEGEVLGIVGPNGSGKTSLLNLLAGTMTPQEGTVCLFGTPLMALTPREVARLVGVVPQDTQQVFPFTVAETVLMGRFPHRPHDRWNAGFGWETQEDLAVAGEAMATMDITHLARRSVTDLSGGERQRTIIARALAQAPKVLLLDEPTAFLDLQHQIEICAVLRRLKEDRGLTIVLVSHDLNLVSQYCDRLLLLDHGRVFRLGSAEEVIQSDLLETVYHCRVLVDRHPVSGLPRVTLPGWNPMRKLS